VRNSVIPIGLLLAVFELGRPRQEQDFLGLERLGDPDLAAIDHISVGARLGERLDARRVEAGVGLCDAEADVQVSGHNPGEGLALELLGAVHDHRVHAEDRHMHAARPVHPGPRSRHLLEQQ
jgi:hypothetical protein